ncbi:MAG: hypothetical protein LBH99_03795 [Rickettsia sp.]|nr:hypothetical protein [Rickettsia sp.]
MGGLEDSTVQAGKAGDIKQEIKNREEKARKESDLKTRPAKKTTTARTNVKKDGSDENS